MDAILLSDGPERVRHATKEGLDCVYRSNNMKNINRLGRLNAKVQKLQGQLDESQQIVDAIQEGLVDAFVVKSGKNARKIFSLKDAESPYRVIVESMYEGAVSWVNDGTILYCNRQFSVLVQLPIDRIIGASIYRFILKDQHHLLRDFIKNANIQSARQEFSLKLKNSSKNVINVYFSVAKQKSDSQQLISSIVTDLTVLTRQKETELNYSIENLKVANDELKAFIFLANHDLQEPLRSIMSFIQLVKQRYGENIDPEGHEYIGYIIKGAERIKSSIDGLLAMSSLVSRSALLAVVDCNQVLESVLSNLKEKIIKTKARITYGKLPVLNANRAQVTALLENLLDNAIKFCLKTPVISIGAYEDNATWIFKIKDNGIGIDHKHFDKLFKFFSRLIPKNQFSGNGMGLAICKNIVVGLGGKIWLDSAPGKGSVFYFTIPK